MKRILSLVAIILMIAAANAQTLQSLFDKYSSDERFTYVTLGSGSLNMVNILGNNKHNHKADIASKMKTMKILTINEEAGLALLKSVDQEFEKAISAGKFETAVEARDKGEQVRIFYRINSNKDADMLILTRDKSEFSVIWISGKMSREDMLHTFSKNMIEEYSEAYIIS